MADTSIFAKKTNVVDSEDEKKNFIVYRGERLVIPDFVECYATIKTSDNQTATFKIKDVSAFGIRVYSHNKELILLLNQVVTINLYFYNSAVFEASASVVNESVRDDHVSYGLNLISSFLEIDNIRAIISNSSHRGNLQISSNLMPLLASIRPEFKALVADLNSIFNEIKHRLEAEMARIDETALNDNHKVRMHENALALSVSLNLQAILEVFNKFQAVVDTLSQDENTLHKKYFRLNFGEMIQRTPFLRRAFEKPLGYPGDFGLMVMFYEYRDLGETIFDKFMHRLSCSQPIAVANQNRVEFLSELIGNRFSQSTLETFKISSVACGPAHEINFIFAKIRKCKKA
jgi:extracellular factor (EF) 3-hydroxypalmitic acid methyl ester biosynthesis protein